MAAVAGPMRVMDWDFSALNLSPKHCRAESHLAPYTGKWVKDKERSESMSGICALMGFNALMQQAVKLIRGLDISTADGNVCVGVCSVISWFKLNERHRMDGLEAKNNRRDLRGGGMTSRLEVAPNQLQLHMAWGGSHAARAVDVITLTDPQTLRLTTTVWREDKPGQPATATSIYRRAS